MGLRASSWVSFCVWGVPVCEQPCLITVSRDPSDTPLTLALRRAFYRILLGRSLDLSCAQRLPMVPPCQARRSGAGCWCVPSASSRPLARGASYGTRRPRMGDRTAMAYRATRGHGRQRWRRTNQPPHLTAFLLVLQLVRGCDVAMRRGRSQRMAVRLMLETRRSTAGQQLASGPWWRTILAPRTPPFVPSCTPCWR